MDFLPGPRRTGWSNYSPFIADFLSDDMDRIEARSAIDEQEWADVARLARLRIDRWGLETSPPGKPSLAGTPVRISGAAFFQPVAYFERGAASTPAGPSMAVKTALIVLGVLIGVSCTACAE